MKLLPLTYVKAKEGEKAGADALCHALPLLPGPFSQTVVREGKASTRRTPMAEPYMW